MSLPDRKTKLSELQEKLHVRAKREPELRFYSLYDKIYRMDVMAEALRLAKSNRGAAGVDGETFEKIEEHGEERWLQELHEELKGKTYQPRPVRRVLIPKPGGGERALGIPTIRDRVVQGAAKLILEPIFEADLRDEAYGYRPGRNAVEAVGEVERLLREGRTEVVDADLSKYFDTIPHPELMSCVRRQIGDGAVLHLIQMWLKAPVEEKDDRGQPRMSGGAGSQQGVPQGGVHSPLLANIYINRLLKVFAASQQMERCGAKIVNYADDFVVVCRHGAPGVLEQIEAWLAGMKLRLNHTKTSIKKASRETFVFLGYEIGLQRYYGSQMGYFGTQPSKQAMETLREEVGRFLWRGRTDPWEQIRDTLNAKLRGWFAYYRRGMTTQRYNQLDRYVNERVRNLLRRRHRLPRKTRRFDWAEVHRDLGVIELSQLWKSHARR